MGFCCRCKDPRYQALNWWAVFSINIVAWVFSVVTVASCSFVYFDTYYDEGGVGIFSYEYDGCESYDSDFDFDSSHMAARAFGVLTPLILAFAFVGVCLVLFLFRDNQAGKIIWIITRVLFIIALISNFITFAFVGADHGCTDDDDCYLGAAGIIASLNAPLMIGLVAVSWTMPARGRNSPLCCFTVSEDATPSYNVKIPGSAPPVSQQNQAFRGIKTPAEQPQFTPEPQSVSSTHQDFTSTSDKPQIFVTEEITSRGKKIIEETVFPDGSKTVKETFEMYEDSMIIEEDMPQSGNAEMEEDDDEVDNDDDKYSEDSLEEKAVQEEEIYVASRRNQGQHHSPRPTRYSDPPGEAEFAPSLISTDM